MDTKDLLNNIDTVLVIDWPTRDVPEILTLAGIHVVVRGGPGPEDYSAYELANDNDEVIARHLGRIPERADLIYTHRPLKELPEIIATAKNLHAKTIWMQSGLSAPGVKDPKGCWLAEEDQRSARNLIEKAGLNYLSEPYIGDVIREIRPRLSLDRTAREPS